MKKILTTCVVALCVLALPAGICAYLLSGSKLAVVETPSMGTYAPVGTLLLTHPLGAEPVRVGETIMFLPPGGKETYFHRVHAITQQGIVTKGDLNAGPDPWRITRSQIVGVESLHVVNLGWLVKAMPVLLAGAGVLFIYLRFFVERYWRVPGAVSGGAFVLAVANYLFHPLVGSVLISKRVVNHVASIVFVNTGMLPLDVKAVGGTSGIAQQGVVFSASTSKISANGGYQINSLPHLEWWTALLLGSILLAPALFSTGYMIRQRVTGRDWYELPAIEAAPEPEPVTVTPERTGAGEQFSVDDLLTASPQVSAPAASAQGAPSTQRWASAAERNAWYEAMIAEYCQPQATT